MKFIYPIGATPIDEDERRGLIPQHISLQSELNEWEQTNILDAESWAFGQRHTNILTISFIQQLHKKMFGDTWKWAGKFRNSLKNIGVDYSEIDQELFKLCGDIQYQLDNQILSIDEIATRLHHRLVWIHPFPNGNGRHSRIYTDIFLQSQSRERFSWGGANLNQPNQIRESYIRALREADKHNLDPLCAFVRS